MRRVGKRGGLRVALSLGPLDYDRRTVPERGFLDVRFDEFAHVSIALGCRMAAEDDSNDVTSITVNGGDEIEAEARV